MAPLLVQVFLLLLKIYIFPGLALLLVEYSFQGLKMLHELPKVLGISDSQVFEIGQHLITVNFRILQVSLRGLAHSRPAFSVLDLIGRCSLWQG